MAGLGWTRLSLAAATTLASTFTPARERCPAGHPCATSDAHVSPLHVLAPFAPPCALLLFSHAPTLFLSSSGRARRLSHAAAQAVALWAAVVAVATAYNKASSSLAYALALHLSASSLFARRSCLLSPAVRAVARHLALAALLAGAYVGPPLPVFDAPGVPGCCGAAAHLLAWAAAETVGAAVWGGILGQAVDD